jgi:hypothetical protein
MWLICFLSSHCCVTSHWRPLPVICLVFTCSPASYAGFFPHLELSDSQFPNTFLRPPFGRTCIVSSGGMFICLVVAQACKPQPTSTPSIAPPPAKWLFHWYDEGINRSQISCPGSRVPSLQAPSLQTLCPMSASSKLCSGLIIIKVWCSSQGPLP